MYMQVFMPVLIILSSGEFSYANIMVYPMESEIGVKGESQVQVISKSDKIQFVRIKEMQLINPGTKQEKEEPINMTDNSSLIVTPQKLAIAGGVTRIVRAMVMVPPLKETTWRVYFESVPQNEFNGDQFSDKGKKSGSVSLNIIWGVLVHVAPVKPSASLTYRPSTGEIYNSGTVRTPLKAILVCNNNGVCSWLPKNSTIYPEMKLRMPVRQGEHISRVRYYNWIEGKTEEMALNFQA